MLYYVVSHLSSCGWKSATHNYANLHTQNKTLKKIGLECLQAMQYITVLNADFYAVVHVS